MQAPTKSTDLRKVLVCGRNCSEQTKVLLWEQRQSFEQAFLVGDASEYQGFPFNQYFETLDALPNTDKKTLILLSRVRNPRLEMQIRDLCCRENVSVWCSDEYGGFLSRDFAPSLIICCSQPGAIERKRVLEDLPPELEVDRPVIIDSSGHISLAKGVCLPSPPPGWSYDLYFKWGNE